MKFLAILEYETAQAAVIRGDDKCLPPSFQGFLDVLQVWIDFFFTNARYSGKCPGIQGFLFQHDRDLLADGLHGINPKADYLT